MFLYSVAFALSFLLTLIFIPVLRKLSNKLGLLDAPISSRKVHNNPTPVVGGLAIGLVFLFVFSLVFALSSDHNVLFLLLVSMFGLLLLLGVLDDRFDIPAKQKFLVQIVCATVMVRSGISLESLQTIFGISLPIWLIQSFTILVIVGVVNAFNLVDGIDGLSGSFVLLTFLWLLIVAISLENQIVILFSLTIIGAVLVFLKFNLSNDRKIFMGDGGTLSLGFLIVNMSIYLFEKSNLETNGISVWSFGIIAILSIPVCDTLIVFARRINHFHSPFKADRNHLHHLFLNLGFSHKKATISIIAVALTVLIISLSFYQMNLKLVAFGIIPLVILFNYFVINKLQLFKRSREIIQNLEKL